MAEERMALPDALRKGEEPAEDPLRQIVRWAVQELMEAEVAAQIGAGRYERSEERSTQRNGYRPRTWDTRVGSLELRSRDNYWTRKDFKASRSMHLRECLATTTTRVQRR